MCVVIITQRLRDLDFDLTGEALLLGLRLQKQGWSVATVKEH